MKKVIVVALISILILGIVYYSSLQKAELKSGFYYGDSDGVYVQINEDGTFTYRVALGVSTAVYGDYIVEDGYLILNSNLGVEFKFEILNKKIKLIQDDYFKEPILEEGTIYEWKKE